MPIFPPALLLIVAGLLVPLFKDNESSRRAWLMFVPLIALTQILNFNGSEDFIVPMMGYSVDMLSVHPFSTIFAVAFIIALIGGGLFGVRIASTRELSAAFIYGGSAIGVLYSGDLISLFIYWEIMAISSLVVVLAGRFETTKPAAMRYALMHFLGGTLLLAGIAALAASGHDLSISSLSINAASLEQLSAGSAEAWGIAMIFIAVLINAAAPPFSAWLADAYPESSPSGTVFLSTFTTKTSVFTLLTLFPATELLIYIGLFMVFYGIVMAILENDMRRILAYSIINQVGFMVTAVGIGSELALAGAAAHAFCHIIYKALLMMSAGSVLHITDERKCTNLGGLFRTMPLTMVCGCIGALAISAFPLTSGFVSKSLISDAAAYEHMAWVWYMLAAATAGVFLHAGIKFPWFVFFNKQPNLPAKDPPRNMRAAMILMSALCILPAMYPHILYSLLPITVSYEPYTAAHVITQLQLLFFGGLAFFLMLPMLRRTDTIVLDFDWFYRKLGLKLVRFIGCVVGAVWGGVLGLLRCKGTAIRNRLSVWHHPYDGPLVRSYSVGDSVLISAVLLGGVLVAYLMV